MLNLRKKAKYVFTAELLSVMTQSLDRLSANYTIDGAEAVVNFQSEGEPEPQQYHIRITPMSEIEGRQETPNVAEGIGWGPEGPPPGIGNASRLNMKKKAMCINTPTFLHLAEQAGVDLSNTDPEVLDDVIHTGIFGACLDSSDQELLFDSQLRDLATQMIKTIVTKFDLSSFDTFGSVELNKMFDTLQPLTNAFIARQEVVRSTPEFKQHYDEYNRELQFPTDPETGYITGPSTLPSNEYLDQIKQRWESPLGIASKLNMKKSAGSYLTPEGQRIFEEAQLDPTTIFLPDPDVLGILSYIAGNSARTLRDLLDDVDEFSANPEEDAALFTEAWQQAKEDGYVVDEEGPEYTLNLSELPKNLPPGIAIRLNMTKKVAGDIEDPEDRNISMFPDSIEGKAEVGKYILPFAQRGVYDFGGSEGPLESIWVGEERVPLEYKNVFVVDPREPREISEKEMQYYFEHPDELPDAFQGDLTKKLSLPPKSYINISGVLHTMGDPSLGHHENYGEFEIHDKDEGYDIKFDEDYDYIVYNAIIDNIDNALLPGGIFNLSDYSSPKPVRAAIASLINHRGYRKIYEHTEKSDEPMAGGMTVYPVYQVILQKPEEPVQDLPGNLPPGIASKLNMTKKALEIGGETFPDALKFKDDTTSSFDVETSIQSIYSEAISFVVTHVWNGLRAQGIIGPDDVNVIQEDVDKARFSNVSSLVRQLMEEGWFKYLEQTSDMKLRSDLQLQQQVFNAIQTAIKEGAA
ncbi:hypothetical protein LCGC14_1645700 [marine sediment metagenome]|uniref:Uncharacterized protein n=1 Tax=marine sediment metagenome TaxID=412755 RepID=A0A0F9HYA4_9ZZZZ